MPCKLIAASNCNRKHLFYYKNHSSLSCESFSVFMITNNKCCHKNEGEYRRERVNSRAGQQMEHTVYFFSLWRNVI